MPTRCARFSEVGTRMGRVSRRMYSKLPNRNAVRPRDNIVLSQQTGEVMETVIERARYYSHRLDSGLTSPGADELHEVASLLTSLCAIIDDRRDAHNGAVFALTYYASPELYYEPVEPSQEILDGGLRARTALGLFRVSDRKLRRTSLPQETY